MKTPQRNPPEELIEALAGIEHEQWMHWSHTAAGEVSDATRKQVATVVGGLRWTGGPNEGDRPSLGAQSREAPSPARIDSM